MLKIFLSIFYLSYWTRSSMCQVLGWGGTRLLQSHDSLVSGATVTIGLRWWPVVTLYLPYLSHLSSEKYTEAASLLGMMISLFKKAQIGKGRKSYQAGVILLTSSIHQIAEELLDDGQKFLLTSQFTQDCLENLFSIVWLQQPAPTPLAFKIILKMICHNFCRPLSQEAMKTVMDDSWRNSSVSLILSLKVTLRTFFPANNWNPLRQLTLLSLTKTPSSTWLGTVSNSIVKNKNNVPHIYAYKSVLLLQSSISVLLPWNMGHRSRTSLLKLQKICCIATKRNQLTFLSQKIRYSAVI